MPDSDAEDNIIVADRAIIHPSVKPRTELPVVKVRPYADADLKYVQHTFYSTLFNLVPNGIYLRAKSPLVLGPWLALIGTLQYYTGAVWTPFNVPKWILYATHVIVFLASIGFPGALLLVWVDTYGIAKQVDAGLDGDLLDPEIYYMGWKKDQQNSDGTPYIKPPIEKPFFIVKLWRSIRHDDKDSQLNLPEPPPAILTRKPEDQQTASSFWVLDIDDNIAGMIGLDQRKHTLDASMNTHKVLLNAHKSNEAEIRRLAIMTEYQGYSLASILLDRAISYAHERGIEWLEAETTECMPKTAGILGKKYGFFEVTRVRRGLYGEIRLWRLDVQRWIDGRQQKENEQKEKL